MFSFLYVGPRGWIHLVSLGSKSLCLLSYFSSFSFQFLNFAGKHIVLNWSIIAHTLLISISSPTNNAHITKNFSDLGPESRLRSKDDPDGGSDHRSSLWVLCIKDGSVYTDIRKTISYFNREGMQPAQIWFDLVSKCKILTQTLWLHSVP